MAKRRKPPTAVEDRIEITASPQVVWTCFSDLGRWPQWFPALTVAEWTGGTPWTLGARLRQAVRLGFPFGTVTSESTIVEISPAPYAAWKGTVGGMEAVHGFRFDPTACGTEVISRHEFYGPAAHLLRPLFLTRRLHYICRAGLRGLKAYVETGTVQLKMSV